MSFKKYLLNFGVFRIHSSRLFSDMNFSDGMELLDYVRSSGASDESSDAPIFFDSKEEALEKLSTERISVYEDASVVGYDWLIELPFLEEWDCARDIHEYDPDFLCVGRTIAASSL